MDRVNRRAREWKGEHEARYVAARAHHDAQVARVQEAMDGEAQRAFAQRLKRYGRAKAAQAAAATDARAHAARPPPRRRVGRRD